MMISTDIGNGTWNSTAYIGNEIVEVSVPHGRVQLSGFKFQSDLVATDDIEPVTWLTNKGEKIVYAVGDEIVNFATRITEEFRSSEDRYGSDHHIFGAIYTLACLGIRSDTVRLIVPMPPSLMTPDMVTHVRERLTARPYAIKIGDRPWQHYTIREVFIIPEGAGAYAAYAIGKNGKPITNKEMYRDGAYLLGGRCQVVDLGYGTGDSYPIIGGVIVRDAIVSATRYEAGVQAQVVLPLLAYIREKINAPHLREIHIDQALRNWVNSGYETEAATLTISGKRIDLSKAFERQVQEYAEWVVQQVIAPAYREGADVILAAGGGWMLIADHVKQMAKQATILTPDMFTHLKGIPPYALNSYGGLLLAKKSAKR